MNTTKLYETPTRIYRNNQTTFPREHQLSIVSESQNPIYLIDALKRISSQQIAVFQAGEELGQTPYICRIKQGDKVVAGVILNDLETAKKYLISKLKNSERKN